MVHQHSDLINEVYLVTQYKFRNESLLLEVFSPPYLSSRNVTPCCFERLEFLGDSVLNLVVSILLFELYPMEPEGDLTLRKNDLVSGRRLAEIGRTIGFMKLIPDCPTKITRRESDTLEALIGAIFMDGGFKSAKAFITRNWKKPAHQLQVAIVDPKSKLYIWAQKQHLPSPVYKIINKTQSETNFTLTLHLKSTHGLGIVKLKTDMKKRGELNAATAMLARIHNREKWKNLFKSEGNYITEEDLILTSEDITKRLSLWCMAHNMPSPKYKTEKSIVNNKTQFTTLVTVGEQRGAYGVSINGAISEKKAALKMLLRLCDEERERAMFEGEISHHQIDLCLPQNFKSMLDEWVTRNHLGQIMYNHQADPLEKIFNVSLVIPDSDLGEVFSRSYKKKLAEHKAAALMIERILTHYNSSVSLVDSQKTKEEMNYKTQLHSWTHRNKFPNPVYTTENVTGLKHSLLFTVSVNVKGQNKTCASDYSKRQAQQKAAKQMMRLINRVN